MGYPFPHFGLGTGEDDRMALKDPIDPAVGPVLHDSAEQPLDVLAVAQRFGVSPRTVRRLAEAQAISHYRVGRRRLIRFRPEDVDEYLKRSRVSAVS